MYSVSLWYRQSWQNLQVNLFQFSLYTKNIDNLEVYIEQKYFLELSSISGCTF